MLRYGATAVSVFVQKCFVTELQRSRFRTPNDESNYSVLLTSTLKYRPLARILTWTEYRCTYAWHSIIVDFIADVRWIWLLSSGYHVVEIMYRVWYQWCATFLNSGSLRHGWFGEMSQRDFKHNLFSVLNIFIAKSSNGRIGESRDSQLACAAVLSIHRMSRLGWSVLLLYFREHTCPDFFPHEWGYWCPTQHRYIKMKLPLWSRSYPCA